MVRAGVSEVRARRLLASLSNDTNFLQASYDSEGQEDTDFWFL